MSVPAAASSMPLASSPAKIGSYRVYEIVDNAASTLEYR